MPNLNNNARHPNKPPPPSRKTAQQMRDEMQDATLAVLGKNQERQDNRTLAITRLGAIENFARSYTINWFQAAKHIGSAYVMAYNKHKEVLGKQNAKDGLNIQIIFSVLTVVSAGSLAWIGLSTRLASLSEVMRDSIEDAAQAGIGEVFSAVSPLLVAPSLGPVDIEPQIFQNQLEERILDAQRVMEANFGFIKTTLAGKPLEFWDDYDEKEQLKQHDDWLKRAAKFSGVEDLPIGSNGKPDVQMMADELERGIWAKYILSERYYRDFGVFGKTASHYEFVGIEACKRLEDLGILKITHEARNVPESEEYLLSQKSVDALARWAKEFQPKSFATMRRAQEKIGAAIKQVAPPMIKYLGNLRRK